MSDAMEGYGYADDEAAIDSGGSALVFGLNPGITMTKFEYITNGGKGGAEGEALDIVFNINGTDKSFRKFPVTKAYGENNVEITDLKAPEVQEERKNLNTILSHIMGCFVSKEALTVALSVPLAGPEAFKTYCKILMGLLPKDFAEIKLDVFAQYQWQITGENTKTYLEFPKKMKYGKWLVKSVLPVNTDGSPSVWTMTRKDSPSDGDSMALYYQDGAGNVHPFQRNGWFVNSNFANQQKEEGADTSNAANMAPPVADANSGTGNTPTPKGW